MSVMEKIIISGIYVINASLGGSLLDTGRLLEAGRLLDHLRYSN